MYVISLSLSNYCVVIIIFFLSFSFVKKKVIRSNSLLKNDMNCKFSFKMIFFKTSSAKLTFLKIFNLSLMSPLSLIVFQRYSLSLSLFHSAFHLSVVFLHFSEFSCRFSHFCRFYVVFYHFYYRLSFPFILCRFLIFIVIFTHYDIS